MVSMCTWYNLAMENEPSLSVAPVPNSQTPPSQLKPWLYFLLVGLALAAGISIGYILWGRSVETAPPSVNQAVLWQVIQGDDPYFGGG